MPSEVHAASWFEVSSHSPHNYFTYDLWPTSLLIVRVKGDHSNPYIESTIYRTFSVTILLATPPLVIIACRAPLIILVLLILCNSPVYIIIQCHNYITELCWAERNGQILVVCCDHNNFYYSYNNEKIEQSKYYHRLEGHTVEIYNYAGKTSFKMGYKNFKWAFTSCSDRKKFHDILIFLVPAFSILK